MPKKGYIQTKKHRENNSIAHKGFKLSDERKKKIEDSRREKGLISIDPVECYYLYCVENLSIQSIAKRFERHFSTVRKMLVECGVFIKHVSWNKGKKRPPFSDEWKRKMSDSHIDKKLSEEAKKKIGDKNSRIFGEKSYWYGKHHTPETIQKMKDVERNYTPKFIEQASKNGYGINCYYKGEFFPSKFERDCVIRARELDFEVMHNFLDRFDAKAKKGNFEAVMEFHMFYKGKDRIGLTEEQYYNQRRKLLDKYGYKNLKLIVIKDLKEIENKLGNNICKKM